MAFDKPYTPQKDSLASMVCGFFRNNSDEMLSLDDITDKFMAARSNVHTLLGRAVQTDLLVRRLNTDGEYIYRGGKNLLKPATEGIDIDAVHQASTAAPAATQVAKAKPAQVSPPKAKRAAPAPAVALPDIADVVIETGVPLPSRGQPRRDWTPLLIKLKPGQSAVLPIQAKAVLSKDITLVHAAKHGKFVTQTYPEKAQVRVWRAA